MIPWEREDGDFGILKEKPMATNKRTVGPVTGASAVGGSLGAALAQLIVHVWPYLQEVEAAVTIIMTAILAVVGGYLIPPKDDIPADQALVLNGDIDADKVSEMLHKESDRMKRLEETDDWIEGKTTGQ